MHSIQSPLFFILPVVTLLVSDCSKSEKSDKAPAFAVQSYQYEALPVPEFFKNLIANHLTEFQKIEGKAYTDFCKFNHLNPHDSLNIRSYYTLTILHKLFTSKTASNGSRGDILDIPYMWHWGNPNPRHDVYFVENNVLLSQTTPPGEFSRYGSYADIDRTPYLFISDLVADSPKYYSAECDTFSTFGWCSEREMAFVALCGLLGYKGKVVAQGNHSWSEFIIAVKNTDDETEPYFLKVDNTFDDMQWFAVTDTDTSGWSKEFGNVTQAPWYNEKARATSELHRIQAQIVSQKASARIESRIVNYLQQPSPAEPSGF